MKRIVVLAAVLIAISTVSVNAAATTVPESVYADSIAPYYETAFDAVSTLTLSGKTVKCESKLRGHFRQSYQQYIWITQRHLPFEICFYSENFKRKN